MNNTTKQYNTIEWFEQDGNLYGERGLSFNIETNIVTKFTGVEEPLDEKNLPSVLECIKMNKFYVVNKIKEIYDKLAQTETIRIPIENGYEISEPLSDKGRKKYLEILEEYKNRLNFLTKLKIRITI